MIKKLAIWKIQRFNNNKEVEMKKLALLIVLSVVDFGAESDRK